MPNHHCIAVATLIITALACTACKPSPRSSHSGAAPQTTSETVATGTMVEVCTTIDPESFETMSNERIDGLKLGLPATDVTRLFGKPNTVDDPVDNTESVGTFNWSWRYPQRGLQVEVGAEERTGPQTVTAIALSAGSDLRTRLYIGIGSSVTDVKRAYGPCLSNEWTNRNSDRLVAGSVYGGVFFSIGQGVVTEIFVGSAAE